MLNDGLLEKILVLAISGSQDTCEELVLLEILALKNICFEHAFVTSPLR